MTTAIRFRRRRADLPLRWFSTGCGYTHSNAPSQRQSEAATTTRDGYLDHQHLIHFAPGAPLLDLERIAIVARTFRVPKSP